MLVVFPVALLALVVLVAPAVFAVVIVGVSLRRGHVAVTEDVDYSVTAAVLAMLALLVLLALTAMQALALLMVAVAMLAVLALLAILVLLALPVLARLLVARHQIHGLVSAELPVLPVLGRQADQPEAAAQQEILPLLAPLEHLLGALADQREMAALGPMD